MSLEQKSSRLINRPIICLLAVVAIGVILYATLKHSGILFDDGNNIPAHAENEPDSKGVPILYEFKIIKAGEGAILCETEDQCISADSGMEGQTQKLVSVTEDSIIEYRLENKWHRHLVQGTVTRTHTSSENPYLLSLLLENGWIKGELKNIAAVIQLGKRYCEFRGGTYSASYSPDTNASEFKLHPGLGKCFGDDGSVYEVSPGQNTVMWEAQ